jgi:heat shock protein HspQ
MIAINEGESFEHLGNALPKFFPGDLICHKHYGYRGVVVAVDGHCKADPNWYMSNKTQPSREQPWYHVLVHSTESCTYAAESSLEADPNSDAVKHPFVGYFFEGFEGGKYIRNQHPWPDSK